MLDLTNTFIPIAIQSLYANTNHEIAIRASRSPVLAFSHSRLVDHTGAWSRGQKRRESLGVNGEAFDSEKIEPHEKIE